MAIPGVAHASGGENGLLGLAVSPHYDVDRLVYAYYSTASDNRIARFRLGAPRSIETASPSGAAIIGSTLRLRARSPRRGARGVVRVRGPSGGRFGGE